MSDDARAERAFGRLVGIMRRLRAPDGCPWDREQDPRSLRRFVLEEAYEVVQAIDDDDPQALTGELGDLALQIVFLAQLADEAGEFDVADVLEQVCDKLVRRHPHVFEDTRLDSSDAVIQQWERLKLQERGGGSVLDDLPAVLPSLARAEKLGRRAAQRGFDWRHAGGVVDKVREELAELVGILEREGYPTSQETAEGAPVNVGEDPAGGGRRASPAIEEELGDLLYAVANLARHLGLSPEVALRRATEKFERRFRRIEAELAAGGLDAGRMDELWESVKAAEKEG